MKVLHGLAAAAVAMTVGGAAQAALIFTVEQVGANVVVTGSGALDTTGLSTQTNNNSHVGAGFIGVSGTIRSGSGLFAISTGLTGYPATPGFGGGSAGDSSSDIGPLFGIIPQAGVVFLPIGYVSGSALSNSSTFSNKTIAGMGLITGSYSYSVPRDTITINIVSPAAVPEPASWAMMLAGFGLIGGALRRRRVTVSFG